MFLPFEEKEDIIVVLYVCWTKKAESPIFSSAFTVTNKKGRKWHQTNHACPTGFCVLMLKRSIVVEEGGGCPADLFSTPLPQQ